MKFKAINIFTFDLCCNFFYFGVLFCCITHFASFQMAMYKGKKSDPNKPKRPMTAYFIFLGDFRTKMKNRGVDHKEILRLGQ